MSRRRKNAGEGYGYMFHGAFSKKADAVAKERKTKGAWVKFTMTKTGPRYVVMSPRTNPIKRKKTNPVSYDPGIQKYTAMRYDKKFGNIYASGFTKKEALKNLRDRLRQYRKGGMIDAHRGYGHNPSELLVMGANPLSYSDDKKISKKEFARILREHGYGGGAAFSGATRSQVLEMIQKLDANRARYGENPHTINAQPGETITIRVNPEPRENLYLGLGPSHPSRKQLSASRREFKSNVRRRIAEDRAEYSRLRKSARGSFKNKKQLEALFHEVYGQNPHAEICGARIGGYVCTRKPGHSGPHLPQGATLRPRSRHNWGPRGNPSAEALRERFTGTRVEKVKIYDEPHMRAGDYAMLGKLLSPGLYIKPRHGGQVMQVTMHGTVIVSDERAQAEQGKLGPIWFVGGDQDVSSGLEMFGAKHRGNGIFELGELRRIDYQQRKEHVEHPERDHWRHDIGEENGIRPMVLFDSNTKRILLEGGDYRIEDVGIVN